MPNHVGSAWTDHAAPAVVVIALLVLSWHPRPVVSEVPDLADSRVAALADVLADPAAPEAIERALASSLRFAPDAEATRAFGRAIVACGTSPIDRDRRMLVARGLYATTAGGDVSRADLERQLDELARTLAAAGCGPAATDAAVASLRRMSRTEPHPRRDWW